MNQKSRLTLIENTHNQNLQNSLETKLNLNRGWIFLEKKLVFVEEKKNMCEKYTEKEEEENIWRKIIFGPRRRLNKQHDRSASHINLIAQNKRFNSVGSRHKPR